MIDLSKMLASRYKDYVFFIRQALKSSSMFAIAHPEIAVPDFVTFVSPTYSSSFTFMPIRFKATK
eukprot:2683938-Karenia_brevis.AAC.1